MFCNSRHSFIIYARTLHRLNIRAEPELDWRLTLRIDSNTTAVTSMRRNGFELFFSDLTRIQAMIIRFFNPYLRYN